MEFPKHQSEQRSFQKLFHSPHLPLRTRPPPGKEARGQPGAEGLPEAGRTAHRLRGAGALANVVEMGFES